MTKTTTLTDQTSGETVEINDANHPELYWRALEGDIVVDGMLFVNIEGYSAPLAGVNEGVSESERMLVELDAGASGRDTSRQQA